MHRTVSVDDQVVFVDKNGAAMVARVTHVWPPAVAQAPPLLNVVARATGDEHTSVPHKYAVAGAKGFFWE